MSASIELRDAAMNLLQLLRENYIKENMPNAIQVALDNIEYAIQGVKKNLHDLILEYGRAEWACGHEHKKEDHPQGHCPDCQQALLAIINYLIHQVNVL